LNTKKDIKRHLPSLLSPLTPPRVPPAGKTGLRQGCVMSCVWCVCYCRAGHTVVFPISSFASLNAATPPPGHLSRATSRLNFTPLDPITPSSSLLFILFFPLLFLPHRDLTGSIGMPAPPPPFLLLLLLLPSFLHPAGSVMPRTPALPSYYKHGNMAMQGGVSGQTVVLPTLHAQTPGLSPACSEGEKEGGREGGREGGKGGEEGRAATLAGG